MRNLGLVFVLLVGVVLGGLLGFGTGFEKGQKSLPPVIPIEIQELSRHMTSNPVEVQPTDMLTWTALLHEAKLCKDCNAFQEFLNSPRQSIRPFVLSVPNDTGSVVYTIVFGRQADSNAGQFLTPQVVYYIASRDGARIRIDGDKIQAHGYLDEWHVVDDGQVYAREARQFFEKRWRTQLAMQ